MVEVSDKSVSIVLGGKTFVVRPLTLRQIRDIEVTNKREYESNVDSIANVLDVILKRDHADKLPEGGVLDLEISREEIANAAEAVTKLTGGGGDATVGEAEAATPAVAAEIGNTALVA